MYREITFPDGRRVKNLGQGSWFIGDNIRRRQEEIDTIRRGIELGITLIDTAEMYGSGRSEDLIGEAIQIYNREDLFIVSKVLPSNASRNRIFKACAETLDNLQTDYLDLYLLHWQGATPLQETVDCLEELKADGKIKGWGVSNFDVDQMEALLKCKNGENCQVNQVLYHMLSRGIEFDLIPFQKEKNIPIMAYCPMIGQEPNQKDRFMRNPDMQAIAQKHHISMTQLLLAFVMQQEIVIPIPKASSEAHVVENAKAWEIELDHTDNALINYAFPAPQEKVALHIE